MPVKCLGAWCAAISVGIMDLSKIPLFTMLTERMAWLNKRQAVLAQNIANADTPGYKPKDPAPVDFEVIVISGYAEDSFRERLEATANVNVLPKPFSPTELAGKVKDVLEA